MRIDPGETWDAIRKAARARASVAGFASNARRIGAAVGFDGGDLLEVGELTRNGLELA
jgi:hypothetical protein